MRTAPVIAIVVAALLSAAPRLAQAQSDYPIRPVSLIVPYASGGVADVAMRLLGDKLSNRLGQQFVNREPPGCRRHCRGANGSGRTRRWLHVVDDGKQQRDRRRAVHVAAV